MHINKILNFLLVEWRW